MTAVDYSRAEFQIISWSLFERLRKVDQVADMLYTHGRRSRTLLIQTCLISGRMSRGLRPKGYQRFTPPDSHK
jgi:hypothetical protein